MNILEKNILLFLLLFVLSTTVFSQAEKSKNITTVSYCEIAKEPTKYVNQTVRIRVIYRVGFEWSEIYSLHCTDAPSTWLDFSPDFNRASQAPPPLAMTTEGNFSITAGVVFVGRLTGAVGRYGHLNSYKLEFAADSVEEAIRLDNHGYVPGYLTEEDRKRIQQFEDGESALSSGIESKSFDNLYYQALQAYVSNQGAKRSDTLFVQKEDWFENPLPTKFNDQKITYVTAQELAELYQKEKHRIPLIIVRPIKNEGSILIVAFSNYYFSYQKNWRRKNFTYALEGGTRVKFRFNPTQNKFVILQIETWGV